MKKTSAKVFAILLVLAIIIEFFLFLLVYPRRNNDIFLKMDSSLEYREGTSPLDNNGIPLWVNNSLSNDWVIAGSYDYMGMNTKDQQGNHEVFWMRLRLVEKNWTDPALFILGKNDTLLFFRSQILTNIIQQKEDSKTLSWNIYPLTENIREGEFVYIHFPQGYDYENYHQIIYGSMNRFLPKLIIKDIIPFSSGILFIVTGMIALLLLLKNFRNPAVFAFAMFSLVVGIFTIARTDITFLLIPPRILNHTFYISMWFLTPAVLYFIEVVFELPCTSFIRKLWSASLALSFIYLSLFVINLNLFLSFIWISYSIVTTLSLLAATIYVFLIKEKSQEKILFTFGLAVFILYSLGDLSVNYLHLGMEINMFWGMLWLELIVGTILYSQFNQAQLKLRDYSQNLETMVEDRTNDLQHANEELEVTLNQLKAMQKKIIQQEKLASLGGLTAGIAHEIKNPLNFVNNFSTVSIELLDELKENLSTITISDEDKELISDLEQSISKIYDHGKRADGIVQSMLLHSRGTSGEFKKVDLNSILLEYANLAYHGMRAQDISFQVDLDIDLDSSIGEISIVPQDISRAFLNIVNNACYAANDRRKSSPKDFEAKVSIKSKKTETGVEIIIRDNGKGIPREIQDSIFDPFFTTKPAGEGTGLGLSISYDIIVSEHRGQLELDTKKGEYTEFRIWIPDHVK